MLQGDSLRLRPVREADLEFLYDRHLDLETRGMYFPHSISSETAFRQQFHNDGFWSAKAGMLLLEAADGAIVGHIEFFKTVNYLDELELAYRLYDRAAAGQGYATQAVRLLSRYLFEVRRENRIRLMIHPDNKASQRVAQKCGFRHEGTARGVWWHFGRSNDMEVYALLRDEAR